VAHAVFVHLFIEPGHWDLGSLHSLEDALIERVDAENVGVVDGHDVAMSGADPQDPTATIYLFGLDADALTEVIEPTNRAASVPGRVVIVKRYGDDGAPESRKQVQ
jgi:hypothetical protein